MLGFLCLREGGGGSVYLSFLLSSISSLISVVHSGIIFPHLESLAFVKVFSFVDACSN